MFRFSSSLDFKSMNLESMNDTFKRNAQLCVDYVCNYANTIDSRPVTPDVKPGYLRDLLPAYAPEEPEDFKDVLDDIDKYIMPGTTHCRHPDNYAHLSTGGGYCNILADMLATATGGVGFSWTSQPSLTELEIVMMDWLGRAFDLPPEFLFEESKATGCGTMMSSASDCIFSAMTAARYQTLEKLGVYKNGQPTDIGPSESLQKLVCYISSEAHPAAIKACNLNLVEARIIQSDEQFKLTGPMVEEAIKEDMAHGRVPFMIIATVGSMGGCAIDDVATIGLVAQKYGAWLHVDGTYGINALILPEIQHLRKGLQYADTINCNPLHLLNGAAEFSCLWIRNVTQYKKPWLIQATYLIRDENDDGQDDFQKANEIDFRDYGVPLSRRMRSIKIWLLFRTYGVIGLQQMVRDKISLANYLASLIQNDHRFEVLNVKLGVVCFRQCENEATTIRPTRPGVRTYLEFQNMNLVGRINKSHQIHIVPAVLRDDIYCLRFSINYEFATTTDVERAWKVVQSHYVDILDPEYEDMFDNMKPAVHFAPSWHPDGEQSSECTSTSIDTSSACSQHDDSKVEFEW